MNRLRLLLVTAAIASFSVSSVSPASADDDRTGPCRLLPTHSQLRNALKSAQSQANGGFNF